MTQIDLKIDWEQCVSLSLDLERIIYPVQEN